MVVCLLYNVSCLFATRNFLAFRQNYFVKEPAAEKGVNKNIKEKKRKKFAPIWGIIESPQNNRPNKKERILPWTILPRILTEALIKMSLRRKTGKRRTGRVKARKSSVAKGCFFAQYSAKGRKNPKQDAKSLLPWPAYTDLHWQRAHGIG